MTTADERCQFTLDSGHPCNHPLPCPHHKPADQIRARIAELKTQLDTQGAP